MSETVKEGYSLRHTYRAYKEDCREREEVYGFVNEYIYRKICKDFNEMVVAEAIEGKVVRLPYNCGSLGIKKVETNYDNLKVDWGETDKLGIRIYHTNQHSDGFFCRWVWTRPYHFTTAYYHFNPVRSIKKRMSNIMKKKDGHKRYFTRH